MLGVLGPSLRGGAEATPVSVCAVAEYWNNCTGGITSFWRPEELFIQTLRMPVNFVPFTRETVRSSFCKWRQLWCRGGQCRQVPRSVWTVLDILCYPGCGSHLVPASSGYAWISRASWLGAEVVREHPHRQLAQNLAHSCWWHPHS